MFTLEALWQGPWGDEYHDRNKPDDRRLFWAEIIKHFPTLPKSVIELGAGKGENLAALHHNLPDLKNITAVEINPTAVGHLKKYPFIEIRQESAWDAKDLSEYDLAIVRGFLIHVPAFKLNDVLTALGTANKYVVMIEYMDTERREIPYHGKEGALWADNFAWKFGRMNPRRWVSHKLGENLIDGTTTFLFERK